MILGDGSREAQPDVNSSQLLQWKLLTKLHDAL